MRKLMLSATVMTLCALPVAAKTLDAIKAEFAAQGLKITEEKSTFLGRLKLEAVGPSGEREVVLTRWGRVLKDEFEFEDENGNGIHDEFEGIDD